MVFFFFVFKLYTSFKPPLTRALTPPVYVHLLKKQKELVNFRKKNTQLTISPKRWPTTCRTTERPANSRTLPAVCPMRGTSLRMTASTKSRTKSADLVLELEKESLKKHKKKGKLLTWWPSALRRLVLAP